MSVILVTGGAGFIGSHTCKALAAAGFVPVTFDNLSTGHAENVRWGPLVVGDILDRHVLDQAFVVHKPLAVIHFAGLAYVGDSFRDPLGYYRTNTSGMVTILEAMIASGTGKIVFSSSCTTYGLPEALPISESARQSPISPYGRSKLASERIIKDASAAHGTQFVIFRYFNACGADSGGALTERHHPETHLIPLAIDAATGRGRPLEIYGSDYPTSDGTCERDFVHVTDLASAHVEAVGHLIRSGSSLEVNLGTGRAYSVLQVIAEVERIVGRPVPVTWGPRRPGDPPILFSDPTAARYNLGFAPKYSDLATIVTTAWRSRWRMQSSSCVAREVAPENGTSG
jgi:UDP-arabinose 4-epimerase